MGACFSQVACKTVHVHTKRGLLQVVFSAWRIQAMNMRSRRDNDRYSTSLAALHQRIADNEETVASAIRIMCSHPSSLNDSETSTTHVCHVCVVCLHEEGEGPWFKCECDHHICPSCARKLCKNAFDKGAASDDIVCPSLDGCNGRLDKVDLYKIEEGRVLAREIQHRNTVSMILDLLHASHDLEGATLRMKYIRYNGTYGAYQCPKCLFGPLEHMHCNDLVEWHGNQGHTNTCPHCGHLTRTSEDLLPWSGEHTTPWSS